MQQDKPVTIDVFFAANGRVFFSFHCFKLFTISVP